MSYEPRPGSVAFRALAHMELLHTGSEIMSSMLASAVGVEPKQLLGCLEGAINAKAIFCRQKGGHERSPLFWSLIDHSNRTHPTGANRDASAEQSHDAGGSESPAGRGTNGASALGAAPPLEASTEAAQVDGKEPREDHADRRSPMDEPPSPSIVQAWKARALRRPAPRVEEINIDPGLRITLSIECTPHQAERISQFVRSMREVHSPDAQA